MNLPQNPVVILGSGIHIHNLGSKNTICSNWKTLLRAVSLESGIEKEVTFYNNPSLIWEDMLAK